MDAVRLVFGTLRTGFPTARVEVTGNGLDWGAAQEVQGLCHRVGGNYTHGRETSHDAWIENLIMTKAQPFWICDTDVVFFGCVENWFEGSRVSVAGRFEPEFLEEWTRTRHVARLHTCLMYVNPNLLRPAMRAWQGQVPALWGSAQMNLVRQMFIPVRNAAEWRMQNGKVSDKGETLFYDTMAGCYQAGIGEPFREVQDEAFEHLHCGTYADLVSPHLSLPDLQASHRAIYAEPARARGIRKEQMKYYAMRRPGSTLVIEQEGARVE